MWVLPFLLGGLMVYTLLHTREGENSFCLATVCFFGQNVRRALEIAAYALEKKI
jgi:hypothetical protein